jgi:hypothetical protein
MAAGEFAKWEKIKKSTNEGGSNQQVPPLRIAIGKPNRNAPVGMTDFILGSGGQSQCSRWDD